MKNSLYPNKILLAVGIVASLFSVENSDVYAQHETAVPPNIGMPTQTLEKVLTNGQVPLFVYNHERPDPFFPFLSQEILKAEAKAKAELTGTQKFEPTQLTLVAIVSGKRGLLAMVQDSSGVGYVLRKGTKIGETGEVVQIAQDKVIIEQSLKNVTGERISRKIEMTLSKEGEK